jgi:hypothetical protein
MSTGDFEAQVRQSVADHLALIQTAAAAAKARIVTTVSNVEAPAPEPVPELPVMPSRARPAVDFSAEEPAFADDALFNEASAFADAPSALPEGAIAFDDLAVESVDDEGIPVWEDPP